MKKKQITVARTTRKSSSAWTTVPKIQIEGFWLEDLGYHVGDRIILEYDEFGIRIRPLTKTEQIEQKRKELEDNYQKRDKELRKLQAETAKEIARLSMVAESHSKY